MERDEVLAELQRRITGADGALMTTVKSLAAELGIKPERLYYLIRSFEKRGLISTVSHGPKGMEFRPGNGEPKAALGRRGRLTTNRRTGARFCPWCGQAVEASWHFCPACGDKLPSVG